MTSENVVFVILTQWVLRTNAETGESRTGSGGVDQRLGSNSPTQQQQAGMDPNNAAYLALRNHPETTIRPIGSGGPGSEVMRSPGAQETGAEASPRTMEDNIFKQVSRMGLLGGAWLRGADIAGAGGNQHQY